MRDGSRQRTSTSHAAIAAAIAVISLVHAGCECGGASTRPRRDGGDATDAGGGGGLDGGVGTPRDGGPGGPVDAYLRPNPDAFFHEDPPPSTCYPDGGMGPWPDPPGGTPECPDDRRREGCRCDEIGATGPCWPGARRNRMRGICRDGVSTCEAYDEFGGRWSACAGAVLPTPGVTRGPAACECFSMGRWQIDNLSPCFVDYGARGVFAVSTFLSGGSAMCPRSPSMTPPPAPEPGTTWSTDRLTVDCAGRFRLCYTLKAGNADTPAPGDCVVTRQCVETWYPTAGAMQELPPIPAWTSSDSACARSFRDSGGYGEMSVIGLSIECDEIDDGMGAEYVFNRVNYCPLRCNTMPTLPECMGCMMGGSGSF